MQRNANDAPERWEPFRGQITSGDTVGRDHQIFDEPFGGVGRVYLESLESGPVKDRPGLEGFKRERSVLVELVLAERRRDPS